MSSSKRRDKKGRVDESVMQYYRRILQELNQGFEEDVKGNLISLNHAIRAATFFIHGLDTVHVFSDEIKNARGTKVLQVFFFLTSKTTLIGQT